MKMSFSNKTVWQNFVTLAAKESYANEDVFSNKTVQQNSVTSTVKESYANENVFK